MRQIASSCLLIETRMRPSLNHQSQSGTRTTWMRFFIVASLLVFCSLSAPNLFAQKWKDPTLPPALTSGNGLFAANTKAPIHVIEPSPVPITKSSNRFLFVIDTSANMKRHAVAIQEAVEKILTARAGGQFFRGDTIGIWTFDSDPHIGEFPLQIWSPEYEQAVASRSVEFLKKQRYHKQSRLDQILPSIFEVIQDSDLITIIFINDGLSQIQGTPFDRAINTAYQQNLRDMKKDRMPIVTVLQAKAGKIKAFTVNALPWPVVIPELPITVKPSRELADEPPTKLTPTNRPAEVAKTKPVAPVQPVPTPVAPAPDQANTPPPPVSAFTALPVSVPPQTIAPTPSPAPVTPPPVQVAKVEPPAPATTEPPPANVQVQAVPAIPTIPRPPIRVPAPKPAPPAEPAHSTRTEVVTPPPTAPEPSQAAAPEPASPVPAVTPKPSTLVEKSAPVPAPEETAPHPSVSSNPEPANLSSPQAALATPYSPVARSKGLLIGGLTLLVLAVGLIALLIHRSRTPSGPSLITRSMNQRKQ
ncbi:MAG: hypothetical protein JWQ71_3543 [Pedosphaera sp.]|nr:hypothetical protein [Pedosphaera sp.]